MAIGHGCGLPRGPNTSRRPTSRSWWAAGQSSGTAPAPPPAEVPLASPHTRQQQQEQQQQLDHAASLTAAWAVLAGLSLVAAAYGALEPCACCPLSLCKLSCLMVA